MSPTCGFREWDREAAFADDRCCTECGHRTNTVTVLINPVSRPHRFCGLCVEDLWKAAPPQDALIALQARWGRREQLLRELLAELEQNQHKARALRWAVAAYQHAIDRLRAVLEGE